MRVPPADSARADEVLSVAPNILIFCAAVELLGRIEMLELERFLGTIFNFFNIVGFFISFFIRASNC